MAVREITRPVGVGGRGSKYSFTSEEVESAVKMLEKGKTPGVGPYDDIRQARSAAQALARTLRERLPSLTLGTSGWVDPEDGKGYCQITIKG